MFRDPETTPASLHTRERAKFTATCAASHCTQHRRYRPSAKLPHMKLRPLRLLSPLLGFACSLGGLRKAPAQTPKRASGETRAQTLIRVLDLRPLPGESGYLGLIGASAQNLVTDGRNLPVQSQVYYLLTEDLPINYLHWLASDDTHVLIEGGPVDYSIFCTGKPAARLTLGLDLAAGQRPVIAVPGGCWKALELRPGVHYALMANALSPAFTPDRVRIGEGDSWIRRFAGTASWATPGKLRALIGPNWIP